MDDICLHYIIPYINDNVFIDNISILCKNKEIQERRIHINKIKSANKLKKCFNYYFDELMYTEINEESFNECMKECVERLLYKYSLCNEEIYYLSNIRSPPLSRIPLIFCKKFVSSRCHIEYTNDGKRQLIFNNFISTNTKICSVYRVSDIRRYMLKDYLTVRALIY